MIRLGMSRNSRTTPLQWGSEPPRIGDRSLQDQRTLSSMPGPGRRAHLLARPFIPSSHNPASEPGPAGHPLGGNWLRILSTASWIRSCLCSGSRV
jgi:hypothetical protein